VAALVYATQQNIADRYGNDRLLLLADRDGDGIVDTNIVNDALADARATTDSYLHERYQLPLSQVPAIVVRINVDLAMYYMANNESLLSDLITQRKVDALNDLTKIAAGKIKLDVPSPPTVGGGVTLQTSPRIFGRDKASNW
jgi:phage gp36-like protein